MIVLFSFVQIKKVQTYFAHKAADYLSERLHTRVEISSVDIEFFKKVVLENVYIEDLHHDTLLYAKKLKLDIGDFDLKLKKINVREIELITTTTKLIQYKVDKDFNYQFIIDAFASDTTAARTKSEPWDIRFKNVKLTDADFVFRNEKVTDTVPYGINYFDLHTQAVNGELTNIRFDKDTIFGTIEHLSTKEKSGFVLKDLSTIVKMSSIGIQMDGLKIKTPKSSIATDLTFKYKEYPAFYDFINLVSLKAEFHQSQVDMTDISYFAPALKGLNKQLIVSGKVSGTIADLSGNNMNIVLSGSSTQFVGDIRLSGLPDIDKTIFYLNIDQFKTNYTDLAQIPGYPFDAHQQLAVPDNIAKLGNTLFKGTFTGLYTDFHTSGSLSSALGVLSLNLTMNHDSSKKTEKYTGKFGSSSFDFGYFLGSDILGKATVDLAIDGSGLTLETISAKLKGTVLSLDFKNYTYKNIVVEGNVAERIFNGKLNVTDDNIDLDFNGKVDYSKPLPDFNFIASVKNANLSVLHLIPSNDKTSLSTHLQVNVTGNTIDNLIGKISIDSTVYKQNKKSYTSSSIYLLSEIKDSSRSLKLLSDFAEGKISGDFKISTLPVSLEKLMSIYLPQYFNNTATYKDIPPQNFNYEIKFKNSDAVTDLWIPQLNIAPSTKINGSFNSISNQFSLQGSSNKLTFNTIVLKNWKVNINTNHKLLFNTFCERLYVEDSTWFDGFNISGNAQNDSVNWAVNWDNKSVPENKGDIKAFIHMDANDIIKLKILPSQLVLADSVWNLQMDKEIVIDSSSINVNKCVFQHNNQSITLSGIASENKTDQLKLTLDNFNLENFNFYTKSIGLEFKGSIDGESTVSDIYHNLIFISNNTFESFYLNGSKIGNGDLQSLWDNKKNALYVHGTYTLGIVPNVAFSGYYYPKNTENNIDMEINLQAIQMKILEPFVKEVCSDFSGLLDGTVTIKGSTKKPLVSGFVNVDAQKVTISYLKTSYNFFHKIVLDSNSFSINDMIINDINHNTALVNGKVHHDNFKNFQFDIAIDAKKIMGLNTKEVDNSLFYGTAFVTGGINISGTPSNITIDADIKTESIDLSNKSEKINVLSKTEFTRFYIPLTSQSDLGENDFVTFIKKDSSITIKNVGKAKLAGITMNLNLEATTDAEVQLIFDQRVGDIIKAKGNGKIKLNIDTEGEFKMVGNYVIENGSYLFTSKNLINKKFDIEKGSSVKWSGIPYKADLNVTAIYKTKALLTPFFDSTTSAQANINLKNRYPVELKLLLTGDLLQPVVNFGLNFPTINPSVQQTILGYLNTEAEMNRQIPLLLLASTFVQPIQLQQNNTAAPTVGNTAVGNSVEMLSNQLGNMLNSTGKNPVNLGVNYNPGNAVSKKQMDMAVSTQLFNNKISIDGNLGVNNNNSTQSNSNNIVGDVNIEYKLTKDGKVRIKTFNKTNDMTLATTIGPYTQGAGIFYREDFETFGDLIKRYRVLLNRKKETTATK